MTQLQTVTVYRCPECLGELIAGSDDLQCTACAAKYPILEGLPLLCRQRDFYYGEVSREVMRGILERAREKGWQKALLAHADAVDGMDFYDYAASDTRAAFKFLLDRFETGVALDYGCGPGTIATSLARNFAHVYATDLTLERAEFTRLRAAQDGIQNLTVFCSGDTPHVPLPGRSADVVILNGVLEWIPDFRAGKPRAVQLEFLREMRRILKDDGLLYIGIENRTGYGYFLGQKEEHTLLPFASLLPRPVADFYSRRARGKPFRTYTYTRRGYQSLLSDAGLHKTQFFGLLPSYREIERAFRTTSGKMVRESLRGKSGAKSIRNALARPIFPAIVGSFGIVAANEQARPFFERLTEHVARTYASGGRLEVLTYRVSQAGAVHLKISGEKGSYYLKLPLSERMERRMARGVDAVLDVRATAGDHADALLIPYPIAWDRFLGQPFLLEPQMPGDALDQWAPKSDLSPFFPKLIEYLALFGTSTRRKNASWAELLADRTADYARQLTEAQRLRGLPGEELEAKTLSIAASIEAAAGSSEGFGCSIHGDFWHGNILFDPREKRLTSVMDWDFYEADSLPFIDLFNLLVKDAQYFSNQGLGQAILELDQRLKTESPERRTVAAYAERMGIDSRLAPLFLIIYWIRQTLLLLKVDLPKAASAYEEAIGAPLRYFYEAAKRGLS